jgi:predicted transposase YdaD
MTPDKPKHDKIFHKSMENPIVAKEFLATHLPKDVLTLIDSTTLKLEKDSFIEPDLSKVSRTYYFLLSLMTLMAIFFCYWNIKVLLIS